MDSRAAPVPLGKPALPQPIIVEQGTREIYRPSTFESRWSDLPRAEADGSGPEIASSSFETPENKPEINQPDPPASELVTTSAKGSGGFFPLDVTLLVIVMSMGGALILLACLAPSILYMRDRTNRSTGIHGLPEMRIMTVSGLGPPLTPAPPFFGGERRAMDRSAEGRR
ncbi:hypothetical protein [Bradyrhizobium sp.]|uniref:hypothetical protein n=1 Tax=Bradyrhizobium sp. TaxID=376 RepID=UPI0025C5115A|nr:hypothetical protein [Bradyrhizobium sp.]